jgi:two-component system sensor histidine kinase PilS (NtrC family)
MNDFQQLEYKDTYKILTGRLLIIAFVLSVSILQNADLSTLPNKINYKLFIIFSLISFFYYLIVKLFPVQRTFIFFQLIIDVLIVTLFSTVTGITDSTFNYLFFIIIITGSIFLSFTQGILLAIIGALLLAAITYVTKEGIISIFPGYSEYADIMTKSWKELLAKLSTLTFGMIVVSILSGYLSNNIKNESILISEILTNLTDGVLVIDTKDRVTYINQEICSLFKLTNKSEEYISMKYAEFSKLIQCESIDQQNKKKELNSEEIEYKKNGMDLLLEIRSIPIYKKKQQVKAMIFIIANRTVQKELREISQRAQRLGIVNDLAANIVHEIRNPIASISGAIQEVKNSSKLDEFDNRLLNIVARESNRLSDIVTHFLEYSRLQTNLSSKCNLTHLFRELITMLKVNPNSDKIKFILNSKETIYCKGDQNQLHQVFLNLALNAIEMQENLGEISINIKEVSHAELNEQAKIFFKKLNKVIEVSISDQGPGMSTDIVDKIFDPFFTTKASGTGLGLSIVQKIVESHGGLIQVSTAIGKGTIFRLYFHCFNEVVV